MFQASFKVQSAGAIIAAVMWATAATAPALGQAKHEEIAIGYASRSCVMTPLHVAQEQQTWPRSKGVALAPRYRAGGGADAGRGYRADATLGGALVEAAIRGAGIAYIASTSNHLTFSIYSRWEITRPEDLSGG